MSWGKDENKRKEAGIGPFLNKLCGFDVSSFPTNRQLHVVIGSNDVGSNVVVVDPNVVGRCFKCRAHRTSNVEAVCVKRRLFFGEIEPSRSSLKVINYYRFMHCPRRRSVRLIVLLIQADFLTSLMLLLPTSIHQRNTKNIKDRQIMSHPITAAAADDMLNIDLKWFCKNPFHKFWTKNCQLPRPAKCHRARWLWKNIFLQVLQPDPNVKWC